MTSATAPAPVERSHRGSPSGGATAALLGAAPAGAPRTAPPSMCSAPPPASAASGCRHPLDYGRPAPGAVYGFRRGGGGRRRIWDRLL